MKIKVISAQKFGDCELAAEDGQNFYLNLQGWGLKANDELELSVPAPPPAEPVEEPSEDEEGPAVTAEEE